MHNFFYNKKKKQQKSTKHFRRLNYKIPSRSNNKKSFSHTKAAPQNTQTNNFNRSYVNQQNIKSTS